MNNQHKTSPTDFREHILWMLNIVFACVALTYVYNEAQTPFYQSTAVVSFEKKPERARLLKHAERVQASAIIISVAEQSDVTLAANQATTFAPTWLDRLLKRTIPHATDVTSLTQRIREALSVQIGPDPASLSIEMTDPDPKFAMTVANIIAAQYLGSQSHTGIGLPDSVEKMDQAIKQRQLQIVGGVVKNVVKPTLPPTVPESTKTELAQLKESLELNQPDLSLQDDVLTIKTPATEPERSVDPDKLFNLIVAFFVSVGLSFTALVARYVFLRSSEPVGRPLQ